MKFLRGLMRGYANAFVAVLSAFLVGIAYLATDGKTTAVNLPMLPWTGADLVRWLYYLGGFGLLAVLLNVTGLFRYLLPVATLVALVMAFRGFFWLPYTFAGEDTFYAAIALVAGALLAFLFSLRDMLPTRQR